MSQFYSIVTTYCRNFEVLRQNIVAIRWKYKRSQQGLTNRLSNLRRSAQHSPYSFLYNLICFPVGVYNQSQS